MTHFNKGPSYGLSAEVKNKVRARAVWGRSAAGREGCEPPRRDVGAAREVRASQLTEPARTRWLALALFPRRGRAGGSRTPGVPQRRGARSKAARCAPRGKRALQSGLWPLGGAWPRGWDSGSCRPRHPPGSGLPWDPASPPILAPSSHKRSWAVTWPNRAPHCSSPSPWEGMLSVPPTPGTRGRKGSPLVVVPRCHWLW